MDLYQHDSATMFQFVLRGELGGDSVGDLEHAWTTAKSILAGKELVVDVSGITNADPSGVNLLSRMRESGARLTAALPPASKGVLSSLGLPVAAPDGRHGRLRAWRLLRFTRPCE
jgi:ABC-type transporter Mla MlaB component